MASLSEGLLRPLPSEELADPSRKNERFAPAPDLLNWVRHTFIAENGILFKPRHKPLAYATLGFLWTNVENIRQGNQVAGQAEIPGGGSGNKWAKARAQYQLQEWFGAVPDFLITLDAPLAQDADDREFCRLIRHELLHCAQREREGELVFDEDGLPKWCIRGHDIEQFIEVVDDFGATAEERRFAEAVLKKPLFSEDEVKLACGNCLR